jgi:DNA-binding NarL/FixJ family response regulator
LKTKVAIVDDEAEVRASLAALLNGTRGLECVGSFGSSQEALVRLPRLKVEVALIDILMPDTTGIALTQALKLQLPQLRVILLTGLLGDEAALAALQAGADGFLLKPASRGDIAAAIAKVLTGERYFPQEIAMDSPELLALTQSGLAFPARLTAHAFDEWEKSKSIPRHWLVMAEDAAYSVPRLAQLYGLSQRQLEREWPRCFGTSPGQWLRSIRMARAAFWIWQGKKPTGVAAELNYKRPGDFCRAFKQFFHTTTSEFRRAAAGRDWAAVAKCYLGSRRMLTAGTESNGLWARPGREAQSPKLSLQEERILKLVAQGLGNKAIAERTHHTANTVESYVKRICGKLGAHSRYQAVVKYFGSSINEQYP